MLEQKRLPARDFVLKRASQLGVIYVSGKLYTLEALLIKQPMRQIENIHTIRGDNLNKVYKP
jgi:hypothetical protein